MSLGLIGRLQSDANRAIEEAMRRNPEGRTIPGSDPNVLLLTADDCVWMWMDGIGF